MHTTRRLKAGRAAVLWAAALCAAVPTLLAQGVSGPDTWAANCGSCHRLRSLQTYTASQWNTIVTHMGLVARLTPAQTRAVREFLVGSAQSRQAAMALRDLVPDLGLGEARAGRGGAAAIEQRPAQAVNRSPLSGRDVFRAKCAACHGPEGRGNGAAAAGMNPRPTNFMDGSMRQATTDSAIGAVIEYGRRGMPAFSRMLTRAELDSVIAYVKTFRP